MNASPIGFRLIPALLLGSVCLSAAGNELHAALRDLAKQIDATLPIRVTSEMRLENALAMQDTVIFKYRFFDEKTINNPHFQVEKYLAAFKASQISHHCASGVAELLRHGAKLNFLLIRMDGRKVIDWTMTTRDCAR